jgi:hypothetical protein
MSLVACNETETNVSDVKEAKLKQGEYTAVQNE